MGKQHSKRYQKCLELSNSQANSIVDAVSLLGKMPRVKFDESVELSFHLGVDPKQSDQMVRGIVTLPSGSGKVVRVLVFTENPVEALEAGAQYAGLKDLMEKIQGGWCDFDVAIATPSAMKEVRSVARILGPRGLMPNPKSGTVTEDVARTIHEVQMGRVEFKMDKTANLSVVVGRRSFTDEQLIANIQAAFDAVMKACPESFRGKFIHRVSLSSTMSPGIELEMKSEVKA